MHRARSGFYLVAFTFLLASCSEPGIGPDPVGERPACTFTNPVGEGADPWVVRHGGSYYSTQSTNQGIYVYKSDKLTDLKRNGVLVWTPPATGWNRTNIWAPELHFIDGRWYIYYAAGEAGPPLHSPAKRRARIRRRRPAGHVR